MKNILPTTIYLLCAMLITFSCKKSGHKLEPVAKDKIDIIKLVAQSRPGGKPKEFNMPIDKGLDKLEFVDTEQVKIDSSDLVLGMSIGNYEVAIPITYLSGFEVANLKVNDNNYLVTWCPLVGSARIFNGEIKGDYSGFDFGRGLRNNNLLIVDRKTNSVWNQLSCKAIHGELEGNKLIPLPTIQSTWSFWKQKHPETKLVINRDTSGAVFPSFVFEKPHYNTWEPGKGRPEITNAHDIENLGLGIELGESSIFFPLDKLFENKSPMEFELENQKILIYFSKSGLTAWAEDEKGKAIPSTIVYNWAWKNFFPNSREF